MPPSKILEDVIIAFGRYVANRKSSDLPHTDSQHECFDVFMKLMEQYKKVGLGNISSNTALPNLISEYMRGIPFEERETQTYKSMIFMIKSYNAAVSSQEK